MVNYPYTNVTGKLKLLLEKIREVGVPPKITIAWLDTIGFKSSNDPRLLPILKFINFADSAGVPTDIWRNYRGADYRSVLANAIRQSYSELFELYPNANSRSDKELVDFFNGKSNAGKQAIEQTTATFKALCDIADFTHLNVNNISNKSETTSTSMPITQDVITKTNYSGFGTSLTININIELAIPETTDEKVYDNFFAALKRHLLPDADTND